MGIETKFNVGDSVYLMDVNGKVRKIQIHFISARVAMKGIDPTMKGHVDFPFSKKTIGLFYYSNDIPMAQFNEHQLFASKQDLAEAILSGQLDSDK